MASLIELAKDPAKRKSIVVANSSAQPIKLRLDRRFNVIANGGDGAV